MTTPTPERTPMVTPTELSDWLHKRVDEGHGRVAIRVAEGWAREAAGREQEPWPTPVPDGLWSAVLELAGLAYDNPLSQSARGFGEETDALIVTQRASILDRVRRTYGTAAVLGGPVAPVHSFPAPPTATGW